MSEKRVKFSTIVKNQFPEYVIEESPLSLEFFSEYYRSQEYYGAPVDLIENLDDYNRLDTLTNFSESTTLTNDIAFSDDTITVDNTVGFPDSYGLIKIDNELITYVAKTDTSFTGCLRGFSGITSFTNPNNPEELIFSESESNDHTSNSTVQNLSKLFLKEFLIKLKKQIAPGFERREFHPDLNKGNFIKQLKDFYSSRGTDTSFKILFKGGKVRA